MNSFIYIHKIKWTQGKSKGDCIQWWTWVLIKLKNTYVLRLINLIKLLCLIKSLIFLFVVRPVYAGMDSNLNINIL